MLKEINEDNLSIKKDKESMKKKINNETGGSERETNRNKNYRH